MKFIRFLKPALIVAILAALALSGYLSREKWLPWFQHTNSVESATTPGEASTPTEKIIVSDQAQKNLGLTAKRLKAQIFWKTIQVPGMVVDRPGQSDRSVVAPATGVVVKVAHFPGDTVGPGEVLFTLKLSSESLHATQTELFKATQDIELAQAQRKRLADASGSVPEARTVEMTYQITRLQVTAKAARQELGTRGFSPGQIDAVAEGKFVREIQVVVPSRPTEGRPLIAPRIAPTGEVAKQPPTFEVQELKIELGQQVQAGQTLCLLANHQALAIEGRAFRDETPLLEQSVKERWPVDVDFQEDVSQSRPTKWPDLAGARASSDQAARLLLRSDWPALDQEFRVRRLANNIDPVNRTFAFLIPLENQSRMVEDDGRTQMLWRFRPGQKVRILVKVEKIKNVFVLPSDAVAREGPEAFIFTQNVNTLERIPVRVILQERDRVVLDNDGSLATYSKDKDIWTISAVAQTGAAQFNRMVKAGSSGVPKGYHIHADGSLHKNEDEGK